MQSPIVQIQNLPLALTPEGKSALPFRSLLDRTGRCLLLSMRHFGDAVIVAGFVRSLQSANPRMQVDILGQPDHEQIFRTFCNIGEYLPLELPLFRHHRRSMRSMRLAFMSFRKTRKAGYEFCINLIGDAREIGIGSMTGAAWNISPAWDPEHPFRNKITHKYPIPAANCAIHIPACFPSYYASIEHLAKCLGLPGIDKSTSTRKPNTAIYARNPVIALHPGASHPSRRWPSAKWKQLIKHLAHRGYQLRLMGAPSESTSLHSDYREEIDRFSISLVATDFAGFFSSLAGTDALVGMDSFSAHAAHILGIPSVVLNGSSDAVIMTPPGSIAVSTGYLCPEYPCNYQYPCVNTEKEFVCCREIEIPQVVDALERAMSANPSSLS